MIQYRTEVMTHGTLGMHKGKINRIDFNNSLSTLGNEGWKLVWVVQDANLHSEKDGHLLVFMKETD